MNRAMVRRLDRLELQVESYLEKLEEQAEIEREHPKAKLLTIAEAHAAGRMPTGEEMMAALRQAGPKAIAKIMKRIGEKPPGLPNGRTLEDWKS
jgi:hypothetical protein